MHDAVRITTLLESWYSGDENALDSIFRRIEPWLRSNVRSKLSPNLRTKLQSLDIVQDALRRFLCYGPHVHISSERALQKLFSVIITNTLRDHSRYFSATRRVMSLEQDQYGDVVIDLDGLMAKDADPARQLEMKEDFARLRLTLEIADPELRDIFLLRERDDLPWKEIALNLGISEASAQMRHRQACRHIAEIRRRIDSGQLFFDEEAE